MDKVYITYEQKQRLSNWYESNWTQFKTFMFPLNKCALYFENTKLKNFTVVKFEKINNEIKVNVIFGNKEAFFLKFRILLCDGNLEFDIQDDYEYSVGLFSLWEKDVFEDIFDLITEITTQIAEIMFYMALLQPEFEVTEEPAMKESRLKKAERHNKYNPTNIIKLTRKVYRLNNPTFKSITKKEYTRIAQSWGVRGHFRNYKSGKTVWVKPYVKGKGDLKNKIYKVEVV